MTRCGPCCNDAAMSFNGAENISRLAGVQTTLSGRGTVGVKLFPARDRCCREREGVKEKEGERGHRER